jgi:hypothetical protein
MGGFSVAAKAVVDAVPKEEMGQIVAKTFTSLEKGMRETDAGNDIADLLKNKYIPLYHSAREKLFQGASSLPKHLQPAPHEIDSQARNIARLNTLGRNDYRGVGLIKAIENQKGLSPLQIQMKQQALADHVHMFLKDTVEKHSGEQSQFKLNVRGDKENAVKLNTAAKYHPPTPAERFLTRLASKPMLAGIAIPHIGTLMNYAIDTNLKDLAKGFAQATFNNQGVRQMVADHGIFASTVADAYAVRFYGSRGIISTATGSDAFGTIVNQLTHQPGFHQLREWTLSIGAATGKLTAERLADQLIKSGGQDKVAIYQLKKIGIEPADVLVNKGLNPDMMRRAIFNYVDSKVFLDNSMQRSFYSQASWYNRLATLYHGYVSRQGAMLRDAFVDDIMHHRNGFVNTAQTLGLLGIAFPAVGVGLKSLEMWGRGQFQEAQPKEDFETLAGKHGPSKAVMEALDGYSHMAAFGIATSYMRSATRHQLLNSAMGPIGNEIANLGQDTVSAFHDFSSSEPNKSFKPLERDALEDTMPDNIGKLLAHQLLPTKSEEKKRHPSSRLPKLKGSKMKKLPRLQ